MNVRKIKRKCGVRGCKNVADVFVISKAREMSNSIAICRGCMKEAFSATEGYVEPEKVKKESKPLFPHPELEVTTSSVADAEPKLSEVVDEVTEEHTTSVAEDGVTFDASEPKPAQKQVNVEPKQKTPANTTSTKRKSSTKK